MKKLLFLFCLTMSLLIFASASDALNFGFLIREATLGRPIIESEIFQLEVQNLADLSAPPVRQRSYTPWGSWFNLPAGDYRVRITYLDRDASESNYTARDFTFHVDGTWEHRRQDLYLQRRDQSFLNIKVLDADTGIGIYPGRVIIGPNADDRDNSIFNTATGGVAMGPEVNTGEMINARPGERQLYKAMASGYQTSVREFLTAAPRGETLEITINLRKATGTAKRSAPPPASKSAPRPKSIPRL